MRKSVFILAALGACALSSGCVTAVAGAAAGVGVFAIQDRTIGEGIDDATASQEVKTRLMAADSAGFAQVDVEVANGSLLLSGAAPTEEHKQAAEMIARNVRSIDSVYNEIFVAPPSGFVRSAADELITAQIRARLTASPNVRAVNINIETFEGNVYLMGTARTEQELQRAAEIASVVSGVRRVVSFMQVRSPNNPSFASAQPPAPEFRGAPMDGAPVN
jgi:osmotically-inducible protein OsmY